MGKSFGIRHISVFIFSVGTGCLILSSCNIPAILTDFSGRRFDNFIFLQRIMGNGTLAFRVGFNRHDNRLYNHRRPLCLFRFRLRRCRRYSRLCFFNMRCSLRMWFFRPGYGLLFRKSCMNNSGFTVVHTAEIRFTNAMFCQ